MPLHLGRLLPESAFLRKLSILAGGSIFGQALVILSSPILTRLFTPAEFGLFAVFSGLAAIGGVIAALRYEFAIPLIADDAEAVAMVVVTAVVSVLLALLMTLLVWSASGWLAMEVGAPGLVPWLWLLPLAMLTWGLGSSLTFWSVRQRTYRVNAFNRTFQLGSQAGGQLGLGFLGAGTGGLIVGYLLGYVVRFGHFLYRLPAAERSLLCRVSAAMVWRQASTHWRYPAYGFPTSLLQSSCQHAPAILIAALYGPALAGFYALSQRIMGLPSKMLSEAASKVFIGEIRDVATLDLHRYFLRTTTLFTGLGLIGAVPLVLFAPPLFALAFGEAWRDAGVMVQLLIPLYLVRFVVQPVSMILYYFKRQELHLLGAALNGLALVGSFGCGYLFGWAARTTILLFSLTSAASFSLTLYASWRLAQRANVGGPAEV
jgi:O-antigen/teichoic acid export membrane protein